MHSGCTVGWVNIDPSVQRPQLGEQPKYTGCFYGDVQNDDQKYIYINIFFPAHFCVDFIT